MRKLAVLAVAAAFPLAAAAAPENYTFDPYHTYVNFAVDHLGFSTMHGRFTKSAGKMIVDLAAKTGSASSSELIGLSVAVMVFVLFQMADMYTLSWWGLWLGYRHDEPGRALRQVLGTVVLGPFAILTVFLGTTVLCFGPAWVKTPSFAIFMASGWILSVWMTSFALCAKAMGGLRDQFREMLTNPG